MKKGRISVTQNALTGGVSNSTAIQEAIGSGAQFAIPPDMVRGTRDATGTHLDKVADIHSHTRYVETLFRDSIRKGFASPAGVISGLSPQFQWALGMAAQASPLARFSAEIERAMQTQIGKGFTLTSPLSTGLVPFDLVAPTLLIYPVYSPLRNRFPRVPGQGTFHRGKVLTDILGALPGNYAQPNQRISIPELPAGGSLTSWPNQLPGMGSQNSVDVIVPYKFFGLTEAVSWLSQFAGQGFDDLAALASLVLLQETLLAEERTIIGGTAFNLSTPGAPALVARTAGSNETALTGVSTNLYVEITATNYYGETLPGASASVAVASGDVVDVTISPVPGAMVYNIYVSTGTSASTFYLMAASVGAHIFTLQGAVPSSGTVPPSSDTGTGASTDYEGMLSILSGHAAANSGSGYPAGYQGGYVNQAAGEILGINIINTALEALYDAKNGYLADPSELWAEASDMTNLSNDLASSGNNENYTLFIQQDQVSNAIAGLAVSQFVNPVTRSIMRLTVHPYLSQGTAIPVSYTLPQAQTNLANVWENVMVQDYISINWPVIDVTFRYSLFFYGTLWCPAPQYNGLIQGLQRSATTPYS
jgi:hypothetical protein